MMLEKKMKEQEDDDKTETSSKASEIATLTKELDGAVGNLKKIQELVRQQENQLSKLEMEKRLVRSLFVESSFYTFSRVEKANFKSTVEMNDHKSHLDLISAEAEELNQAVINIREEKNKLSADKGVLENGVLENAIEWSRLAVVKLQADVDGVRHELNLTRVENETLKDNSKCTEELIKTLREKNAELTTNIYKALELEKITSQKKSEEISSKNVEISSLSVELANCTSPSFAASF